MHPMTRGGSPDEEVPGEEIPGEEPFDKTPPATKVPAGTGGMIDTVVMSGGAPQSPLMAGFLYEMLKAGKTFQSFHTSGAGALMALLFIAPKNGDACKALRNWVEAGVADEVYAGLPVNFKLFRKPGPFTPLFHFMAERLKVPRQGVPAATEDPIKETARGMAREPGPAAGRIADRPRRARSPTAAV